RSAQNRNLADLAKSLQMIQKLSLEKLDSAALVSAFAAAHSSAEVFRLEDIELVFGPKEKIDRDTLFDLFQNTRQRLATSWRSATVQTEAKTKRTDKEIDA